VLCQLSVSLRRSRRRCTSAMAHRSPNVAVGSPACGWRTYSTTSSALSSSECGSVKPIDVAAFTLTVSWNLVG
jgi:hypothetical protein